ncbi:MULTISPECIES: type II toxin-antitoxin system HicA family toxin [Erysipelotrichaceae]|uniref:type II toxin-antitoxin system HicA family toxin n=2 Tax=Erysipelotrichaceae TaxID=128827 RepID=UPI00333F715A
MIQSPFKHVLYVLKYDCKERTMRDTDVLKFLEKNGWKVVRVKGSHHRLVKGTRKTTVAVHGKDVPIGTLIQIEKDTDFKFH